MPDSKQPFGLSAALATPVDSAKRVNPGRLCRHALWCLESGCRTVTLFGSTGEGPSLSISERQLAIDACAESQIDPESIVVAVFATAVDEAVRQVNLASERGVRTVLLSPPFYFPQPDDGAVFQWFSQVIEQAGASSPEFLLYNIPSLTRVSLAPWLVNRLHDKFGGKLRGVKDSSADWATTRRLLEECPGLQILTGDERHLAKGVAHGLAGAISGIANLAPARLLRALETGDEDDQLTRTVDAIATLPAIPSVKYAMEIRHGPGWRRVRAPLSELPDQSAEHIELIEAL